MKKIILACIISLLTACADETTPEDVVESLENKAPQVSLSDSSAIEGQAITFSSTVSDEELESLSFSWNIGGGVSNLTDTDAENITFNVPFVSSDSQITVTLTVTDPGGLSATSTAVLTVINDAPIITFDGDSVSADEGETINLLAEVSTNSSGPLKYEWIFPELPSETMTIDDSSASIVLPNVYSDTLYSAQLIVTDDDGDITSESVQFTSLQITKELTISGIVTQEVLYNGELTLMVGERNIDGGKIGDTGTYSTSIILDDTEWANLITLRANGSSEYSHAALFSILGNINELLIEAGEDGILEANENLAVNLSPVSTAHYSITKALNGYDIVESYQHYIDLQINYNFDTLIETASYFAFYNEQSTHQTDLFDGFSFKNILAFYEDNEYTINLVSNEVGLALIDNPNIFNQHVDTSLNAIVPFKKRTVLDSFNFKGSIWQFDEDGSGSFSNNDSNVWSKHSFTWSMSENKVVGDFSVKTLLNELQNESVYANNTYYSLSYTEAFTNFELTLISDANGKLHFSQIIEAEKNYDGQSFQSIYDNGLDVKATVSKVSYSSKVSGSDKTIFPSFTSFVGYLPLPSSDVTPIESEDSGAKIGEDEIFHDKFVFEIDGTGETATTKRQFNWQINGSDLSVTWTVNDLTETVIYNEFENQFGSLSLFSAISNSHDGGAISSTGKILTETLPQWSDVDLVGVWGSPSSMENDYVSFYFIFHENGDLDYVSNEGLDSQTITYGKWFIEDNQLVMTRIGSERVLPGGDSGDPSIREPDNVTWFSYFTRINQLISVDENTISLLRTNDLNYGLLFPDFEWQYKRTEIGTYTKLSNTAQFWNADKELTLPKAHITSSKNVDVNMQFPNYRNLLPIEEHNNQMLDL